jgi:CTP:molybdopterin cytidylyltransferase MocA
MDSSPSMIPKMLRKLSAHWMVRISAAPALRWQCHVVAVEVVEDVAEDSVEETEEASEVDVDSPVVMEVATAPMDGSRLADMVEVATEEVDMVVVAAVMEVVDTPGVAADTTNLQVNVFLMHFDVLFY